MKKIRVLPSPLLLLLEDVPTKVARGPKSDQWVQKHKKLHDELSDVPDYTGPTDGVSGVLQLLAALSVRHC